MVTNYFAPVILMVASTAQGGILFVDDSAVGSRNGSSWANAFTDLNDALAVAVAGDDVWVAVGTYAPDPTAPFSRTLTFTIPDDVELYGGFAGTEQSFAERAGLFEQTILTGDLAGDDGPDFANYGENSYHVLTVQSGGSVRIDGFKVCHGFADGTLPHDGGAGLDCATDAEIVVVNCRFVENFCSREGGALRIRSGTLTIEASAFEANGARSVWAFGGAIHALQCEAKISHCSFLNNFAGKLPIDKSGLAYGGAVYHWGGLATFTHCEFTMNKIWVGHSGIASGGAILSSDVVLRDVTFSSNDALNSGDVSGGAVGIVNTNGSLLAERCTFVSNRTEGNYSVGGAVYTRSAAMFISCEFAENNTGNGNPYGSLGGAIFSTGMVVEATNCVFVGNRAKHASAILATSLRVAACTIVANQSTAHSNSPAFYASPGPSKVSNSILHGNLSVGVSTESSQISAIALTIDHCCVDGWTGSLGGAGNFDADPRFVDPVGADGIGGTLDDDLRLGADSPCLEAGDNAQLPLDTTDADSDGITNEPIPFDLDGAPRVWFTHVLAPTGVGGPPIVDLGAYERHGDICQPSLGYQGPGNLTLALCGDDLTQAASVATMRVSNGPPLSSVVLAIGSTALPTPFLGGILVPSPIVAVVILPTNASGSSVVPVLNHAGGMTTTFYAQAMTPPPTPQFSNALAVQIGW